MSKRISEISSNEYIFLMSVSVYHKTINDLKETDFTKNLLTIRKQPTQMCNNTKNSDTNKLFQIP